MSENSNSNFWNFHIIRVHFIIRNTRVANFKKYRTKMGLSTYKQVTNPSVLSAIIFSSISTNCVRLKQFFYALYFILYTKNINIKIKIIQNWQNQHTIEFFNF